MGDEDPRSTLNVNVGVMGHVDCGKTSLVAALSTSLSTASLDKHPQSRERGITLDLGFSSFRADTPADLKPRVSADQVQVTLVDCPGHATLLKTILGGAGIIDALVLVIDAVAGVQAQTAECIVVGECVRAQRMLCVINKTDLLPEEGRDGAVAKLAKRLSATLARTAFRGAEVVAVAARPGGGDGVDRAGAAERAWGVRELAERLVRFAGDVRRAPDPPTGQPGRPLLMATDHCFTVKGQGTVMTGTVLHGAVAKGDEVEVAGTGLVRRVRSVQAFGRAVSRASEGDRCGVCLVQLPPEAVRSERGLLCAPGTVAAVQQCVAIVRRVRFFPSAVPSRSKVHITAGHATVMAQVSFVAPDEDGAAVAWDPAALYAALDELPGCDEDAADDQNGPATLAALTFERPLLAPVGARIIGSRLDMDPSEGRCRIAFEGTLVGALAGGAGGCATDHVRSYRPKEREGRVERVEPDSGGVIVRDLFPKGCDIVPFLGMRVALVRDEFAGDGARGSMDGLEVGSVAEEDAEATVERGFGLSGKVRLQLGRGAPAAGLEGRRAVLRFRKIMSGPDRGMIVQ
ncbi:unnamed protein product [Pedinophyceae sp. YPF-701]|nr:unnamed protein product [Pedinophyceae sp. YPF-701]